MELGDGRGSQLGEEDTPYIVEEQIQLLSTTSACEARYYRAGDAVLPRGHTVLPQGPVVLPPVQQKPDQPRCNEAESGRTAGAVLPLPLAVLLQGRDSPDFGKARTYKNTSVATSAELGSMQKFYTVVLQARSGTTARGADVKNYIRSYCLASC